MTQATLGIGAKLAYETVVGASPKAYTEVPEVNDIPNTAETRDFIDATNQDSGDAKEYIPGLKDVEELTLEMNYINVAAQNNLKTMFDARSTREWRIRLTNVSPVVTLTFDGFLSSHGISSPVQDKRIRTIVLRRTGDVTFDND